MAQSLQQTPFQAFAARWGVVTIALCVVHVALSLLLPDSALRMSPTTTAIREGLLGQEFVALAIIAVFPALPGPRLVRALVALLTVVVLASGWVAFMATDRFPGVESLQFLLTVPGQAFEHLLHIRATLFFSIPVLLIAGTVGLMIVAHWTGGLRIAQNAGKVALVVVAVSAITDRAVAHRLAPSPRDLFDPRTGVTYATNVYWASAESDRAGPASTLLRSAFATRSSGSPVMAIDPGIPVTQAKRSPGELVRSGTAAHHWNVLIIEVESLRADMLRAWGSQETVMPTVEAIAHEARRYLDTYTTATQTNLAAPVPLSGDFPLRSFKVEPYPVVLTYPKVMIYDVLQPAGWRAAVFSSQNESWWGMVNFLRSRALDTLFHAENYHGHTDVARGDIGFARFVRLAKHSGKIDDHDTMIEAIRWLASHRDQPFFLYVNMQSSHAPYTTPPTAPRRFGHPPSFPIMFGQFPVDSAEVVKDEYRNALAYIDDQVALLRNSLIADGRWDSTIVVVTGDHGQAFFEHGVAAHANGIWQEQVQVPLLIKAPDLPVGDDTSPASHVDVAPTIAALLGFPAQPAWQGVSLIGDSLAPDRPRFFIVQSPLADERGVVSGEWKLVQDVKLGSSRLTNLTRDPGEHQNVSQQYPAIARRLSDLLTTWRGVQLHYYTSDVEPALFFAPRVAVSSGWIEGSSTNSGQ